MKVATALQMKNIDLRTSEEFGIPTRTLMENAGRWVARSAERMLGEVKGKKIVIVAGPGNNGGDGFVAARHLAEKGGLIKVFLTAPREKVRGDALYNLGLLENLPLTIIELHKEEDLRDLEVECRDSDLVIDALLGTGIKGEVKGFLTRVIEGINRVNNPVLSVDIPSGLNADTGEIMGVSIRTSMTVTMGIPKLGLVLHPGVERAGELVVADIGIPPEAIEAEGITVNLLTREEMKSLLPPRRANSHKGDYGHIFVLAGSPGFTGAATLTCWGALRSGAGLVTLGLPESLNSILEIKLTEAMTRPLPQTRDKTLSPAAERTIIALENKADVIAIGPGLSTNPQTGKLLQNLLPQLRKPVVLDADGLNLLSKNISVLEKINCPMVLTPHPGEMARLLSTTTKDIIDNRLESAQRLATRYGVVVVLKGARSIISDKDGEIFINPTGNPGMASGGAGDVLTGVIASLIGQGLKPVDAAKLGVYLHGLAGDLIWKKRGVFWGIIASEIADELPLAFRELKPNFSR